MSESTQEEQHQRLIVRDEIAKNMSQKDSPVYTIIDGMVRDAERRVEETMMLKLAQRRKESKAALYFWVTVIATLITVGANLIQAIVKV